MAPFQVLFDLDIKIINAVGLFKVVSNFIKKHQLFTCIKRNIDLTKRDAENKKCYICALGPSLKKVNLNAIKGDTIVVNRFFKIGQDFPQFVPTYYVLLDDNFASKELEGDLLKALDTYIPQGTKFILNSKLYGNQLLDNYPQNQLYYISCFSGSFDYRKEYSLDKVMPIFENVVGAAILSAIHIGYKNISLLGCDFNSFASTTRNHCYADESSERWYRMSFELFSYAFAANTHDNIQLYAKRHNIKITNSTKGSLIDAYPVDIEECIYY